MVTWVMKQSWGSRDSSLEEKVDSSFPSERHELSQASRSSGYCEAGRMKAREPRIRRQGLGPGVL